MSHFDAVRQELGSGIVVYPNVIDDKLCKNLMKRFDRERLKIPELPNRDRQRGLGNYRECTTVFVNQLPKWQTEKDFLIEAIRPYVLNWNDRFKISLGIKDSGFELVRYEVGQICHTHCDGGMDQMSTFGSMVMFLNKVEGGELIFPEQKITIAPEAGKAAFFPASFAFPHFTNPALQPRYALVTFFRYDKGRP